MMGLFNRPLELDLRMTRLREGKEDFCFTPVDLLYEKVCGECWASEN